MKSQNTQRLFKNNSQEEIQTILIRSLIRFSVREEMILPVMLMLGESREAMIQLLVFMRDNNPTEHEIIQMAEDLSEN